jgi:hypothetical protein
MGFSQEQEEGLVMRSWKAMKDTESNTLKFFFRSGDLYLHALFV